jgi:hypothetical protein
MTAIGAATRNGERAPSLQPRVRRCQGNRPKARAPRHSYDPRPWGLDRDEDSKPRYEPGKDYPCYLRDLIGCVTWCWTCSRDGECTPSREEIHEGWMKQHGPPPEGPSARQNQFDFTLRE